MTPARKAALQWFHDKGEVDLSKHPQGRPTGSMIWAMLREEQLQWRSGSPNPVWSLTDKGRRMLHGDRA